VRTFQPARASAARGGYTFYERRRVPWWWWVVALAIAIPSVEIVVVFAPEMTSHGGWLRALVTLLVTVAAVAALLVSLSRSELEVTQTGLRADRDMLPVTAIAQLRVLDRDEMRAVLGREARADAYLSTRPWLHTGVQIEVGDPADATPYWVVATRRPQELAEVLRTLRTRDGGDELAGAEPPAME
jgi:hypothetical protein